ncbi:ABC transporter permease [Hoeflea alexandrii]|uniref:ABC transporter permease n=1 Tax=Hoeflea alexandrii TaxID=288436 RepID=UPI0022B06B47|nr:ABC transporter permease [Hoeflea alexandrii]MCZ4291985.1 ABC transporter permease [Hoeflea alexandrii]
MLKQIRRPGVAIAVAVVIMLVAMSIFPGLFTSQDPNLQSILSRLKGPMFEDRSGVLHVLGTDQLGRDIWARIVYGARTTLIVSIGAVLVSAALGIFLGLIGGYVGGVTDAVILRLIDMQLAFPVILLVIGAVAVTGQSLAALIFLMGLASWPTFARVIRSEVLTLRDREFVEAARSIGATQSRIILRHIVPNVLSVIMVVATFELSTMILIEATLSFLGVGVQPPTPTWGGMISEGQRYLSQAWTVSLFPGLVISITILAINTLGDELRDLLDPRLARTEN